jgi:hypothetical protein
MAHHVTVAIKSLYTSEKLFVIPQRNQDLGMVADRLLQNRKGPLADFVLLQLAQLGLVEF